MAGVLGLLVVAAAGFVLFVPRVSSRLRRVMRAGGAAVVPPPRRRAAGGMTVPRPDVQPSMTEPYAYDTCLIGEVKT